MQTFTEKKYSDRLYPLLILAGSMAINAFGATEKASTKARPAIEDTEINSSEKAVETTVAAPISAATKMLTLGAIDTEVENDSTLITVRLSAQPAWKDLSLEDHGTFLQIKFPATVIPNSGEFLDGNGPYLKKIATFQLSGDDGAIRLFINQDAAKAKLATTAELLGERVVITIDHKKLEQLIQPSREDIKSVSTTADGIIQKTVVKNDQPEPSAIVSKSVDEKGSSKVSVAEERPGAEVAALNLKDKLVAAAGFCAAMFVLLLFAHWWRLKRNRKGSFKESNRMDPAAMRILGHLNISSKQRLSLVQVGHQQILIGVSPEQISFLTKVEPEPRPNGPANHKPQSTGPNRGSFGQHLLNSDPNAEVKLKPIDPTLPRPARKPSEQASPQARDPQKSRPAPSELPNPGQRRNQLRVKISDDGIEDMGGAGSARESAGGEKSYDDITRIIRDRLKNLPSM